MNTPRSLRRAAAPLLTSLLAASLVFAQQPRAAQPAAQPKSPARENADGASVTLDTMFGADSYAVYGEMRGVGQYLSSEEFRQMLEPLRLPGSMPSEMNDLIDFLTAHAESMSAARLAFGAMPVADGLPDFVAAVEMPSAEDAQKIEPQIRQFMAGYYAAHPKAAAGADASRAGARTVTLGGSPSHVGEGTRANAAGRTAARQQQQQPTRQQNGQNAQTVRAGEKVAAESAAPYVIKRAGAVVALADKQFTFRRLRGAQGSPALSDEPGFAAARARLASDTLFIYVNTARTGRYSKRQYEEYERRQKQVEAEVEAARKEGRDYSGSVHVAGAPSVQMSTTTTRADNSDPGARVAPEAATTNSNIAVMSSNGNVALPGGSPGEKLTPEQRAEREAMIAEMREQRARYAEEQQKAEEAERERKSQPGYEEEQRRQEFENQLGRVIFTGGMAEGAWSESVGVGASLEGDQLVVHALFYSDSDATPARPVPFVPILLSGPPVAPEAASVVPADSDIFISASLDLPQMYDYVASAFKILDMAEDASGSTDRLGLFDRQISSFEQQGKFRIREDLLNSLGNEIAVVLPGEYFDLRRTRGKGKPKTSSSDGAAQAQEAQVGTNAPVVVISLRDRKTVEGILPRALEAAGVRGVNEGQLFVKRGDADVLAFGGSSAAFLGNFLVVSFDPRALDWIVDSYNRGETLANSEEFRRASGWQQRQLLGQAYVSNALLADAFGDVRASADDLDDAALRGYVSRLDPNPGAITYSLQRDGASLFHELHVPKNLLALMSVSPVVAQQTAKMRGNEAKAMSAIQILAMKEAEYKEGNGRYATLEEMKSKPTLMAIGRRGEAFNFYMAEGYDIRLDASGDKFEITATPNGYPKQGRRSFYVDQTGVLRGGDTGGKPATSESDPVNN
jgi:hypothetical protein